MNDHANCVHSLTQEHHSQNNIVLLAALRFRHISNDTMGNDDMIGNSILSS